MRRRTISGLIRQDGQQPGFLFGLGLVMQDISRKVGEAEEKYRQTLALKPEFAPAYNHLGLVLASGQRF